MTTRIRFQMPAPSASLISILPIAMMTEFLMLIATEMALPIAAIQIMTMMAPQMFLIYVRAIH